MPMFPSPYPPQQISHRQRHALLLNSLPPLIRVQRRLQHSTVASPSSHAPFPTHAQPVPRVMRTVCILSSTRSSKPSLAVRRRRDVCKSASLVRTPHPFLYPLIDFLHCSGARREKATIPVPPYGRADGRERLSRTFLSRRRV